MKNAKNAIERLKDAALREAFTRARDVLFYCGPDGSLLDANPAFTDLYGYSREEVLGRNPRFLRSKHSTPDLYRRMWASLLDPAKGHWRGQIINRTKDGRELPMLLSVTSIREKGSGLLGFLAVGTDLTEELSMKTRVAQAEALANIGEMAAVVAHEIRNPLGSIVIASNQLAGEELEGPDRRMVVNILRSESKRLNEVLANFLSFARPSSLELKREDLNELVSEVCGIIRSNPEMSRKISLSVDLDPKLTPFTMDPEQVRQVIWNMLTNAVQAMQGKGRLAVMTGHVPGYAFFRVSDTGPGIPQKGRTDIFKPFYTTKQQGTGLGLATAERIVKAPGGAIDVESAAGRGATFTVRLPWVEE